MKAISILGCTGSIGTNTLAVIRAFPDRFRVVGLAAGNDAKGLAAQIATFRPKVVSVATAEIRSALAGLVDLSGIEVGIGEQGMTAVATTRDAELVVAAAVGAVGLVPTLAAIQAGKDVALANKETLVMAGEIMTREQKARGTRLLPIDSEHCALHQCLVSRDISSVSKLWLTASGGPFRTRPASTFSDITVEEALNHPTWRMGRKITIDSATLMNKALEIIEAHWLFGLPASRIDVVVHPQSVVHSMVEFKDGTVLAQLGRTDMRIPIQYALAYPEVWDTPLQPMDLGTAFSLGFEPPDHTRFKSLQLAQAALERGGTTPAAMNAANEVAVQAFLDGEIPFTGITEIVSEVVTNHVSTDATAIETVLRGGPGGARAGANRLLRPPSGLSQRPAAEEPESEDRGQGLHEEDPLRDGESPEEPGHDHAGQKERLHRERLLGGRGRRDPRQGPRRESRCRDPDWRRASPRPARARGCCGRSSVRGVSSTGTSRGPETRRAAALPRPPEHRRLRSRSTLLKDGRRWDELYLQLDSGVFPRMIGTPLT